jgi:hypothetical protein
MAVRLVSETEEEERARLVLHAVDPSREDTETATPPKETPPGRLQMIELMGTLARILGFRIQLAVGFLGGLGLGFYAASAGSIIALVAFGMYEAFIFAPLAYIAFRRG